MIKNKSAFLLLLMSLLLLSTNAWSINDISKDNRAYSYVSQAVDKGFLPLDDKGNFNPNQEMTRRQLAEVVCRLKNLPLINCLDIAVKSGYLFPVSDGQLHP
ncbi:MAG: S-layer homology domain-containing protein [Candidatus Margulisiibacteriota bacterium]|jgi:hypothetical protein